MELSHNFELAVCSILYNMLKILIITHNNEMARNVLNMCRLPAIRGLSFWERRGFHQSGNSSYFWSFIFGRHGSGPLPAGRLPRPQGIGALAVSLAGPSWPIGMGEEMVKRARKIRVEWKGCYCVVDKELFHL